MAFRAAGCRIRPLRLQSFSPLQPAGAPILTPLPPVLYARHQHGGLPVHLLGQRQFAVGFPEGERTFGSARSLIRALYGYNNPSPPKDPGITLRRYFYLDRQPQTPPTGELTVFDLFQPKEPALSIAPPPAPIKPQQDIPLSIGIVLEPAAVVLGVDLVHRAHEVRKLLFKGFGAKMARAGYDPEDVLQEVYKGILARNQGSCRFDPRKSSFGHYVHMVCGCILANYHRKYSRIAMSEQVGHPDLEHGDADAALHAVETSAAPPDWNLDEARALNAMQAALRKTNHPLRELAAKSVPLVYAGYARSEIAERLHSEPAKIGKALQLLRQVAAEMRA